MTSSRKMKKADDRQRAHLREIAASGGAAVPAEKRSFKKDPSSAQEAGRLGGLASAARRRARKQEEQK